MSEIVNIQHSLPGLVQQKFEAKQLLKKAEIEVDEIEAKLIQISSVESSADDLSASASELRTQLKIASNDMISAVTSIKQLGGQIDGMNKVLKECELKRLSQ